MSVYNAFFVYHEAVCKWGEMELHWTTIQSLQIHTALRNDQNLDYFWDVV